MFNQSSFPLSFTRKESGAKKAGPDKESGYSPSARKVNIHIPVIALS
jgi:hypothetical protein